MAFYPVFFELENVPVLIAGGGAIALHKAELLLSYGADITVVAPEISGELRSLPVKLIERKITHEDTKGAALVIDASGSEECADILREYCGKNHIPYNCAWKGEYATAIFPAILKKGRTVVAVSTTGASPAACARLRDSLSEYIPDEMDSILERMEELRRTAKESIPEQKVRSAFLHECLERMMKDRRVLGEAEEKKILQSFEK